MASLELIALDTAVPQLRAPGAADRYAVPRSLTGTGGVINVENGVAAQSFNVHNTYTDASNYERGIFDWTTQAGSLTIGCKSAGTGVARSLVLTTPSALVISSTASNIYFATGGNQRWTIDSTNGSIAPITDNATDLGQTGSRVRNIFAASYRTLEGANAKQGTAVLVAGALAVGNTSVTANSRIFLTSNVDGGTPGFLRVSARTAGASFTITSSSGSDTSTVAYEIFEPA